MQWKYFPNPKPQVLLLMCQVLLLFVPLGATYLPSPTNAKTKSPWFCKAKTACIEKENESDSYSCGSFHV